MRTQLFFPIVAIATFSFLSFLIYRDIKVNSDTRTSVASSKLKEGAHLQQQVQHLHNNPDLSTEPFANRWQKRFLESKARGRSGGYLFFKHIRKAG